MGVIQLERVVWTVPDLSWGEQWHHISPGAIQVRVNYSGQASIVMDDRTTPDFLPADQAKAVHSSILLKYLHQVESQCRNLKRKPLGSPEQTLKAYGVCSAGWSRTLGSQTEVKIAVWPHSATTLMVRKLNYMFYEINWMALVPGSVRQITQGGQS